MLDINLIRNQTKKVKQGLKTRNFDSKVIDKILELDKKTNKFLNRIENLRHKQKEQSKAKISQKEKSKLKHLKGTIKTLTQGLSQYQTQKNELMLNLPNLPAKEVKIGKDDSFNEITETIGKKTSFTFKPKDYLTISEKLGLIDIKRAVKVSGARFSYLKNKLVLLQYAIVNYAFDKLIDEGFTPMVPPLLIKDEMMKGLGYIEGLNKEEIYHLEEDSLYLVGTAEQSLVPIHANEILKNKELPKRYFAYTPAFRREAGAYGKDTKGILRAHQFDKVEMVSFTTAKQSDKEHEYLKSIEEKLVKELKIPFRFVKMCTGDLPFPSAKTYDLECFMPGQSNFKETHSCSNTTDFQARRLNIRYRDKNNKLCFCHILNGTVFALGRILIAIIENYQTSKATILVPEILQKYTKFKEIK